MKRLAWLGCAGLVLTVSAVYAAPTKFTTVEGITEYRLDNGLRVLLFPDPSRPTVTVNITYLVGSRHEGYGETGMAHLLEHMLFKGTPDHPQIWKSHADHGANFNGTTSYDRTNYFETLSATDENLEYALALEADRMVNSNIAESDLKSEFSVVRNEFEMGENSPDRVLSERIMSTAYLWHNYGKSTIGSKEDIERVPIDRLKAFYRKYYQPDNAMLVVAGKFDEKKTLDRIEALYGRIPKPTRVLEPTYTVEPPQDGERAVVLRRVGDVQAMGAAYHVCAASHPDMAAVEVLADIMDAAQTGRLYKALVEPQLATRVSASVESLYDPGVITFDAQVRLDKPLEEVKQKMIEVVEAMARQDVSAEEVERAKAGFAKRFELSMAETSGVAIGLSNWASRGDWRLMFLHRDRMKKVTPEDVKRVAAAYLKPSNRTIGMFIPEKTSDRTVVPAAPELASLLRDYHGGEAVAAGEAFDATPSAIESRTKRTTLKSGIKAALLPKKSRGERATVELVLHYGNENSLKGRTEAANMVGPMLMRGTTQHTRREIDDTLDKLKANVSIGSGGMMGGRRGGGRFGGGGGGQPGTLTVSISASRKNLAAATALAIEMLRSPAFPEAEFEKLHKQQLSGLEASRSEPTALAMVALRRKMSPYASDDIRYVPTTEEQIERIKAVKLDDVKKVYNDLIGAGHAELSAVGDFDPEPLTAAIEKGVGDWPSRGSYERIVNAFHAVHAEEVVINTPDKKNSMVLMGGTMEIRDDDPDYPALMMGNVILGASSNSRLINRLRQTEGYSYSVRSTLSARAEDRAATLTALAICAPQNAEKATKAALQEIEKFCRDGITQKELDDARKGYLQQYKLGLTSDAGLAGTLARQTHLGRTMQFTEDELKAVEGLTVEKVNAAIRKYIDPKKLIVVRAGDFTRKAERQED